MDIERTYQLTTEEFRGLHGTELYASMIARKFSVRIDSPGGIDIVNSAENLAELVDLHATGPWYAICEGSHNFQYTYKYYFSNDEDCCFFEKDVLSYINKKDNYNGHIDLKQRP